MSTIFEWLRQDNVNKTAVFIAHRLATVSGCDLIYVLKDGKVVEKGNHAELINYDGVYASMWKIQSSSQ